MVGEVAIVMRNAENTRVRNTKKWDVFLIIGVILSVFCVIEITLFFSEMGKIHKSVQDGIRESAQNPASIIKKRVDLMGNESMIVNAFSITKMDVYVKDSGQFVNITPFPTYSFDFDNPDFLNHYDWYSEIEETVQLIVMMLFISCVFVSCGIYRMRLSKNE